MSTINPINSQEINHNPELNINEKIPNELLHQILLNLDESSINQCQMVCKQWKEITQDEYFQKQYSPRPAEAICEKTWRENFGEVSKAPQLPSNIQEILNSPCPFRGEEGKKVKDTHLLFYIPETLNNRPYTMNYMGTRLHLTDEQNGFKDSGNDSLLSLYGAEKNEKGRWVLMTKEILPGSRGTFPEQCEKLIERINQKTSANYKAPTPLEAATGLFLEYARSKTFLNGTDPKTFTRCLDKDGGLSLFSTIIGSFDTKGLEFTSTVRTTPDQVGVMALREL